jgi:KUP system potassium uptake protein
LFDKEVPDTSADLKAEAAPDDIHRDNARRQAPAALTLGATGVVYGDIGTSPIYAFREALRANFAAVPGAVEVLGILSLLIRTLILIVTVKDVFFVLRAGNRGEGGILALYTLVRLASGKRSVPVLLLALGGLRFLQAMRRSPLRSWPFRAATHRAGLVRTGPAGAGVELHGPGSDGPGRAGEG